MSPAIRPTFSLDLACPSKLVLERLYLKLGAGPHQLRRTRVFGGAHEDRVLEHEHFVLTVAEPEQRLWSPWLSVEVTPQGAGAQLFARFSPHPSVWTFFAALYLAAAIVLLFSLCMAASQAMSRASPWALGLAAGAGAVMAVLWWVSQVGQRLAHAQMDALRCDLEAAITACMSPAAEPGRG